MSALSNAERVRLALLREQAQALPWNPIKGGAALADVLRRALPDVDDVTIGRVALELGQFVGQIAKPEDHAMSVLCDQVMCAGLDLTATEWQQPPAQDGGEPR